MRLQTMYLPPVGGSEHPRFALIADQVVPGEDDTEYQEAAARIREFGQACGAAAVLITPDTVELPEAEVDDEPEPTQVGTFVPQDLQRPSRSGAAAVRSHLETREFLARQQ